MIPCYTCGTRYERKRISGHYCEACRAERKRQNDIETASRLRQIRRDAELEWFSMAPATDDEDEVDYATQSLFVQLDSAAEAVWRQERGVIRDMMPDGTSSFYGSEDGLSTEDEWLGERLDVLAALSECHPWWADNPHWNIGLLS